MKMMHTKYTSTAIGLALALGGFQSAIAQDAAPEEKKTKAEMLIEEVVVYGTKRSAAQNAQAVPAQIAAFGTRQLEARQVVTIEDLTMATPNVSLDGIGTSPGVANFSIRGQGINSSIPSIDPAVGVIVDGVYLGTTTGVNIDMFDMESVEIHKGPQGVLFGRNVTGGAILLRSARPDGEFGVKGKIGIETGLEKVAALSIKGALSDTIAANVSLKYKNDAGYFKNETVGRDVGKIKSFAIRPTIVFTPNDEFDATVIWEHGNWDGDSAIPQVSAGLSPSNPSEKIETVSDNPGNYDMAWDQFTLEMNYALGNGQLTNIFGYRKTTSLGESDIDSTALSLFDAVFKSNQDQISNELRYSGQVTDDWELTVGTYYYSADLLYEESRSLIFDTVRIGGGGVQDHKTWGAFANNYYNLSENLTLQAGIRYSSEEKEAPSHPLGSCSFEQACGAGNAAADKWTNWSPKVAFSGR